MKLRILNPLKFLGKIQYFLHHSNKAQRVEPKAKRAEFLEGDIQFFDDNEVLDLYVQSFRM